MALPVATTIAAPPRILHLADDPTSTRLLGELLREQGLSFAVEQVDHASQLELAIAEQSFQLIVADLPLPWPGAQAQIEHLQQQHPEWPVIYRWGEPGVESTEPPGQQLAHTIQRALHLSPSRSQSTEDRRHVLAELVRNQQIVLDLGRRSTGDFDAFLRDLTAQAASSIQVARVSVWDFDATGERLRCLAMYRRDTDHHESGSVIEGHPRYRAALDSALQIAATDAWIDPRTSEFFADYLKPLDIRAMLDAPIRANGRVIGVLCFEHTGTTRVWTLLEQCLAASLASVLARAFVERDRRHYEALINRNDKLAALGRVAATIAHDFANHLTAIQGLADELIARSGTSEAAGLLRGELASASARVRQLLALRRPSERGAPKVPTLDLAAAVPKTLPGLRAMLGPNVSLRFVLACGATPVAMLTDELEQILRNLAANARDALGGKGEVTLHLEQTLPLPGQPATARLSFADDGPGIAREVLDHLFEPFVTTKAEQVGSGMGLATIHEVARARGGSIDVESGPGGTRFLITLPLVG